MTIESIIRRIFTPKQPRVLKEKIRKVIPDFDKQTTLIGVGGQTIHNYKMDLVRMSTGALNVRLRYLENNLDILKNNPDKIHADGRLITEQELEICLVEEEINSRNGRY